jgi:hypothetical protein
VTALTRALASTALTPTALAATATTAATLAGFLCHSIVRAGNPYFGRCSIEFLIQGQSIVVLGVMDFFIVGFSLCIGGVVTFSKSVVHVHGVVVKIASEKSLSVRCISSREQDVCVPSLIDEQARNESIIRECSHQSQELAVFCHREFSILHRMAFLFETPKDR